MLYGVVLAGGRGERFWPLSRVECPKQFLRLTSDKMMLEETIDRVLPLIERSNIRIVTGQSMEPIMRRSMSDLRPENILAEPQGRNTCLAIGWAATCLQQADPEAVLVVLSADHLIRPAQKLLQIMREGADLAARNDYLITLGIVPTRPETGYGYIKQGEPIEVTTANPIFHVQAFAEKPQQAVAKEYYFSGDYLWNSGMFIWSARSILKAIRDHQPLMGEVLDEYASTVGTHDEPEARAELYKKAPSVSVDVGVLEQADNVLTIKADIIWDDIGDWNSLARYRDRDGDNNVVHGRAVLEGCYETTVFQDGDGLIACLGISDLVVVKSDDIVLVVHKTKAQQVKRIIEKLREDESYHRFL